MKHIFFDCDGVLVDSEIIANRVWVARLERMGLSMTEKHFIQTYAGKREEEVRAQISSEYGLTFEEDFLENILKELDERIHAELEAVKGMKELVSEIPVKMSVVSNSNQYQANRSLNITGMWELIYAHDFCALANCLQIIDTNFRTQMPTRCFLGIELKMKQKDIH